MKKINLIIILTLLLSACKQEPMYQVKDPFGNATTSAVDDIEDEKQDFISIPKKFLNKDRVKEMDRKNRAIQKKLKEASKYDPRNS